MPGSQIPVTTSPPASSTASNPPGAHAQDGAGEFRSSQPKTPGSPAFSEASTADGEDDIESSPCLPALPAPSLPQRARELLRSPTQGTGDENQFGTASWGSPYPRTDRNLRRQSFSSDVSDDEFPAHHLELDTPFLRPAPELLEAEDEDDDPNSSISAAAAVLANRVRRQNRGLTEDWIRTHTTGDTETLEPRHWFSDGSGSEHSSLSGSERGWLEEHDPQTPRALQAIRKATRRRIRHPRGGSSIETLKASPRTRRLVNMSASEMGNAQSEEQQMEQPQPEAPTMPQRDPQRELQEHQQQEQQQSQSPPPPPQQARRPSTPTKEPAKESPPPLDGEAKVPATPTRRVEKPLPKQPTTTPRLKKKVPWKGKNIMVLLPRDEERGQPGKAPKPLRQVDIEKMFASWEELGYGVDGFDLLVEGYQPDGTDDSQSREAWPTGDDLVRERSEHNYQVTLPDLNGKCGPIVGLKSHELMNLL